RPTTPRPSASSWRRHPPAARPMPSSPTPPCSTCVAPWPPWAPCASSGKIEGAEAVNLTLGWLYPDSMSIYGDRGNVIALAKRAEWRGIELEVWRLPKGERLDQSPDLAMFGGGQDREQRLI